MSRGPESALLGGVICEEMEVEHEYYNYGQR